MKNLPTSTANPGNPWSQRGGFSLIEVAVALAVTSFCLTSIVGLIAVGLQTNQVASAQTFTNGILSSVVADLRDTPGSSSTSLQYGIPIPANPVTSSTQSTLFFGTDGSYSATQEPSSVYMVVVTFVNNGTSSVSDKTSIFASISINWPLSSGASAAKKCLNNYQTFIGLDRS